MTPHQRRMLELEAMRGLISDLDALWRSTAVGTVPAGEVAAAFELHSSGLPADSKVLEQFERLSGMIRKGPERTRAEGIRKLTRKFQEKAEAFAQVVEARDAKLQGR